MSKSVEIGDLVSVNYVGRFESGEVFDSSEGGAPLQFTVGQGEVIKGFEKAVIDMKAGEIKTVTIPPEDGYGEYVQNRYIDNISVYDFSFFPCRGSRVYLSNSFFGE